MIDEKKLIEDILQHENVLASANHVYKSGYRDRQVEIIDIINRQPKVGEWIPVSERLPEENDTIFAKFKGTDKWSDIMFEKRSDDVNVTLEFDDGSRMTKTLYTIDGEWKRETIVKHKVIAWMPLPEPYKEKQNA